MAAAVLICSAATDIYETPTANKSKTLSLVQTPGSSDRGCSYLVVLVHAEAAHFGLDVSADMFGGRQEAAFRLKATHTRS